MLLEQTPDTFAYMIAGYVVLAGFPLLYIVSWFWRRRSLEKDLEMIESLKEERRT